MSSGDEGDQRGGIGDITCAGKEGGKGLGGILDRGGQESGVLEVVEWWKRQSWR